MSEKKQKKIESALNNLFSNGHKTRPTEPDNNSVVSLPPAPEPEPAFTATVESVETLPVEPPPILIPPATPEPTAETKPLARIEISTQAVLPDNVLSSPPPQPAAETVSPPPSASEQDTSQVVVFSLADEYFAFPITTVESIIKLQPVTVVPQSYPHVEGVTNLRGTVLPVIDLRKLFGMPAAEHGRDSRIMVVLVNGEKIGVLVDAVAEVLSLTDNSVEELPALVSTVDTQFIHGIAKSGDRLITILDLQQALH